MSYLYVILFVPTIIICLLYLYYLMLPSQRAERSKNRELRARIHEKELRKEAVKLKRQYNLDDEEALYLAKQNELERLRAERKKKVEKITKNFVTILSRMGNNHTKEPFGKAAQKSKDIDFFVRYDEDKELKL